MTREGKNRQKPYKQDIEVTYNERYRSISPERSQKFAILPPWTMQTVEECVCDDNDVKRSLCAQNVGRSIEWSNTYEGEMIPTEQDHIAISAGDCLGTRQTLNCGIVMTCTIPVRLALSIPAAIMGATHRHNLSRRGSRARSQVCGRG